MARTPSLLLLFAGTLVISTNLPASEPPITNSLSHYDIQSFDINFSHSIFPNGPAPALSEFAGSDVSLDRIVQAGSVVLSEFQKRGYPNANISIARDRITNGVVTMNVYQGAFPQVLISGKSFYHPGDASINPPTASNSETNAPAAAQTNAVPHFSVRAYEITGDTLLTTNTLMSIVAKGTGTNVTVADIIQVAADLKLEYRNRGYPTVDVTIPQQKITNEIVKLQVFQGRLSEILVTQNEYFSSNNIMRALPSLHNNMLLVGPIFQAELDRANANQDRQIRPIIKPGSEPNTTLLDLQVKDRLPLHAKVELNNQNSPGTPELRVNSSAVYGNLWQWDHSMGVQYSFSPELYKQGEQWGFYDLPLVANYSGFYRLPIGTPVSLSEQVTAKPGSFGYSEATRKFTLPPASGVAELNLYASRSTIDTGLETSPTQTIYDVPGVRQVFQQNVQQDLTVNNTIGFRISDPLPETGEWRSTISAGLDFKTYNLLSNKTNNFQFTEITVNAQGIPNPPVISTVASPVPVTVRPLQYLPIALRYDGAWRDGLGAATVGLGINANVWRSGSTLNLQNITGSTQSSGYWVTLNPSISQDFIIHSNWVLSARADGQWTSEPLISNEQFGTGGVNSVRGYHEGEVFGDDGWHISIEQKTPGHVVGNIGGSPFILRGSVFMDYAETYLLDPQGRSARTPLWGTGAGFVASIGSSWDARFLFSVPLLSAGTIEIYQPFFNFSLTAQF